MGVSQLFRVGSIHRSPHPPPPSVRPTAHHHLVIVSWTTRTPRFGYLHSVHAVAQHTRASERACKQASKAKQASADASAASGRACIFRSSHASHAPIRTCRRKPPVLMDIARTSGRLDGSRSSRCCLMKGPERRVTVAPYWQASTAVTRIGGGTGDLCWTCGGRRYACHQAASCCDSHTHTHVHARASLFRAHTVAAPQLTGSVVPAVPYVLRLASHVSMPAASLSRPSGLASPCLPASPVLATGHWSSPRFRLTPPFSFRPFSQTTPMAPSNACTVLMRHLDKSHTASTCASPVSRVAASGMRSKCQAPVRLDAGRPTSSPATQPMLQPWV